MGYAVQISGLPSSLSYLSLLRPSATYSILPLPTSIHFISSALTPHVYHLLSSISTSSGRASAAIIKIVTLGNPCRDLERNNLRGVLGRVDILRLHCLSPRTYSNNGTCIHCNRYILRIFRTRADRGSKNSATLRISSSPESYFIIIITIITLTTIPRRSFLSNNFIPFSP